MHLPESVALRPSTPFAGTLTKLMQTIIECLKQACTGDLPPNIKSGQGFIHDPKARVVLLPPTTCPASP